MLSLGGTISEIAYVPDSFRKQQLGYHHGHGSIHAVSRQQLEGHKLVGLGVTLSPQFMPSSGPLHDVEGIPQFLHL